ncbi:MAG: hypothetical protein K0R05_4814 [Anaerocolumna sp.]|nr:hypothetical protein [Anaerocolumna sp.]
MKHLKKVIGIGLILIICFCFYNNKTEINSDISSDKAEEETGKEEAMKAFWLTNQIEDESIMLVSNNGNSPSGNLLFEPAKITEMVTYQTETGVKTVWKEGTDYTVNGKTITALNSNIPFMTDMQVNGEDKIDGLDYTSIPSVTAGLYLPFTEGAELISRQVYVTYEYNEKWDGTTPVYEGHKLKIIMSKLENKEAVNLLVYGDSISTGANSSGYLKVFPNKDSWPVAVTKNLEQYYGSQINLLNKAVGGWTSENAIKNTESIGWVDGKQIKQPGIKVTLSEMPDYKPDLVILGFGMNDATNGIDKNTFKIYMSTIIENIRERNSQCEFILLGTMLANPMAANQSKDQISYYTVLKEIAESEEGIVTVNIGQMHQGMLDADKKYIDMTANNVNHPNDFMASIYTMNILALLIK